MERSAVGTRRRGHSLRADGPPCAFYRVERQAAIEEPCIDARTELQKSSRCRPPRGGNDPNAIDLTSG